MFGLLLNKSNHSFNPRFNKDTLTTTVEKLVRFDNLTYTEALIHLCEEHEIDPIDMAKLVKGPLKEKLELEAMRNHVIPSTVSKASLF